MRTLTLCLLLLTSSLVAAAPPPPPDLRLEGEEIVITQPGIGKSTRLRRPGLQRAKVSLVSLRADGSERAIWLVAYAGGGPTGILIRLGEAPRIIYTLTYSSSQPHISSTSRTLWLIDVDGDGWNDAVEYATFRSDIPAQTEGPYVKRFDPAASAFVESPRKLAKQAPRAMAGQLLAPLRALLSRSLGKSIDRRAMLDGASRELPPIGPPPLVDPAMSLGGGGDPPFVGSDLLQLVRAGKTLHLVHTRFGKQLELVSTIPLGPAADSRCRESLERRDGALIAFWSPDGTTFREQRIPWDGAVMGAPAAPTPAAPCAR